MADERQRQWTGLRIRKLRVGKCMTQQELAVEMRERSGGRLDTLGQNSISNWERGISEVSLRFRRYLAEALEVPMHDLFEQPPDGWREQQKAAA